MIEGILFLSSISAMIAYIVLSTKYL